jgi:hypothetical protein
MLVVLGWFASSKNKLPIGGARRNKETDVYERQK